MKLLTMLLPCPQFFAKHLDNKFDALKMMLAASPFLPWRLKVEIKRIYEIAGHALALPQYFCQTVNPITTKGADYTHYSIMSTRIFILYINWHLHLYDVLSKDRKADQFGSIFIEQNKGFVILALAKALSIEKTVPIRHFENESIF